MKEVVFKKLTIKNFMSVGKDPIILDFTEGLTFITGYNKDDSSYNGVGKTTIINAFFYVLFGTLYGDNSGKLKQSDIVNNITGGTPIVTIEFSSGGVEYVVTRQTKPSKCLISRDGSEVNQNFSIAETNAEICNIISGDAEVYSNIVIMDSDSKPFLLKESSKKIKFVENIFSLGIFSKMAKEAGAELLLKNKELNTSSTSLSEIKRFKDQSKLDFSNFELSLKAKRTSLEGDIDVLTRNKDVLKLKSPEDQSQIIKDFRTKIDACSERLLKGESAKIQAQGNIAQIKSEISRLNEDLIKPDSLVCRLCKQPLGNHSPEDIETQNKEVSDKIAVKQTELQTANEMYSRITDGIQKITAARSTALSDSNKAIELQDVYETFETRLATIDASINSKKSELESLGQQTNPFANNVSKYEKEEEELAKKLAVLEEDVEVLNYVKYLCSPEGVKAHIISKIVSLFNAKLNFFLNSMGSPFRIDFDEFFESTIKNRKGAEVSYHSLSGGERKRVELSCLFAFKDIRRMQSNISINVTMMDELLDSALCSNGMERAIKILQESATEHKESISIITHRASQIDDIQNAKTIKLVKEGGVTKLVDSVQSTI